VGSSPTSGSSEQPFVDRPVLVGEMERRVWLSAAAAAVGLGLLGAAAAHATQRAQVPGTRVEVRPTLTLHYLALNHRRPLFRNNPQLARALNYAIDRPALVRVRGVASGTPTDRLLPYHVPGRSRSRLYPLFGPDPQRARALANGHTRTGTAVIGAGAALARADRGAIEPIRAAFALLGIETRVAFFDCCTHFRVFDGADVMVASSTSDVADSREYVEVARSDPFNPDRLRIVPPNFVRPAWDRRFARAAALSGRQRARAYDRLDRDLMRVAPPIVPYMVRNARFVVANRVGCFTYHAFYGVDLAATCLR
jgi:Bacterial extracellular solute-binding proteins, family 5 Middle